MKKLKEPFYFSSAVDLAPSLLGKILCRRDGRKILRYMITETEAYCGEADTACHAHKGKTKRTSVMYEKGGVAYVYLCYGIHYMLNVVSGEENSPEAVLIRAVEGYNGPGKLTKALKIDMELNRANFCTSKDLWLEEGNTLEYITSPRIGINYATEEYKNKLWRFVVK